MTQVSQSESVSEIMPDEGGRGQLSLSGTPDHKEDVSLGLRLRMRTTLGKAQQRQE